MLCPTIFRAQYFLFGLLTGSFIFLAFLFPVCTAEVSIGTIIDTVGMVHDRSMVSQGYGVPQVNGSATLMRD